MRDRLSKPGTAVRLRPSEHASPAGAACDTAETADLALIGRIAEGDVAAFDTLFRRYSPRLKRFIGSLMRRHYLIDEVLNDTMLAIWLKADTFAMRSKVSTWILGIALRRGLKTVGRSEPLTAFALDEIEMEGSSPGPEEHVSRKELRACLDRAMKSLSPEHRAVIELTYFEGYSYREIASIVGCPADTVKTRMFHARRRLKALLADQREDAA